MSLGASFLLPLAAESHAHPTWADFTATTWIAVVVVAVAAFWSIWKAVMYTIHPGESEPDHIKRLILGEPDPLQVTLLSEAGPVSDRRAGLTREAGRASGTEQAADRNDASGGAEQTHA
jgi:hypothetical protein